MRFLKLSTMVMLFAALLSCKTAFAQNQNLKIGYVDFDEIVRKFYKTQVYQKQLEDEAKQEEAGLKDQIDEINRIKQEMELLSDDAKKEKEKLMNAKIAEAQSKRDQTKRDFQRKAINTMNDIFGEIYTEIEKQGKAGGYTFILRKKVATPAIDQPLILFADESYDLTEKVIEALNKNQAKEPVKGKSETKKEETPAEEPSLQEEIQKEMPKSLENK